MNNESKVKTVEEEQLELISRIAHINAKLEVCQPYTQKSFANCYEAGFKMAANWLFDSNSQLQSQITRLEARNRELGDALETLVSLSGIYEPAKGVSDECDKVIKAIEIAEQALKLK